MIDRYIRTHMRQWEEHLPGKIRFSAARDPGKDTRKGDAP
jgi:hypothetical protein